MDTSPKLIVPEPMERAGMRPPSQARKAHGTGPCQTGAVLPCSAAHADAPTARDPAARAPRARELPAHAADAGRGGAARARLALRAQVGRRARARAARRGAGRALGAQWRARDRALPGDRGGARAARRRGPRARRRDRRARCGRTPELRALAEPHAPGARGRARGRPGAGDGVLLRLPGPLRADLRGLPLTDRKALLRELLAAP